MRRCARRTERESQINPPCPKCGTTLLEDYGRTECPGCGEIVFVDMDGVPQVFDAAPVAKSPTKPGTMTKTASTPPRISEPDVPPADAPFSFATDESAPSDLHTIGHGEVFLSNDPPQEKVASPVDDYASSFEEETPDLATAESSHEPAPTPFNESHAEPAAESAAESAAEFAAEFAAEPVADPHAYPSGMDSEGELDMDAILGFKPPPESTGEVPDFGPPGDPLGLSGYADSEMSQGKDGYLLFKILISGIDSKEMRQSIREVIEDSRFGWNPHELMSRVNKGILVIENVPPVKAVILINRIKRLAVQIRWEQSDIRQMDGNPE